MAAKFVNTAPFCRHGDKKRCVGKAILPQCRLDRFAHLADARVILERANEDRDRMERRVQGLRGNEVDRDQLDERARALLNVLGRDELVMPYGPERRLFR